MITWDCDESKDSRDFFINQVADRDFGYALVDAMAQALGGEKPEGKVAVETTFLTAIDQKNWIAYMKERLDLYPGIQLLETKPTAMCADRRFEYPPARTLAANCRQNSSPGTTRSPIAVVRFLQIREKHIRSASSTIPRSGKSLKNHARSCSVGWSGGPTRGRRPPPRASP